MQRFPTPWFEASAHYMQHVLRASDYEIPLFCRNWTVIPVYSTTELKISLFRSATRYIGMRKLSQ